MLPIYYAIVTRTSGQHLTVSQDKSSHYLLLFSEDFNALSYLNHHARDLASQFAVEAIATNQLGNLLNRWGYQGVALVRDPLGPELEFLAIG
jgi:hypothetical protein